MSAADHTIAFNMKFLSGFSFEHVAASTVCFTNLGKLNLFEVVQF
jgi:hypothetical protein